MSLTKDDLLQIKAVVKESFAEEFPKAFDKEYPRLRKEVNLIFAEGINELILPQFGEMRKRFNDIDERFDEIADWQLHTDVVLNSFYSEMRNGFHFLKSRTEQNVFFTDDVNTDLTKLVGDHYADFEKNYVKKKEHEKLKRRVKKLELAP